MMLALAIILAFALLLSAFSFTALAQYYKSHQADNAQIDVDASHVVHFLIAREHLKTSLALTEGFLTDYYSPSQDVIALSSQVAFSKSAVAISVACHELGHAMQKNSGSKLLKLSNFLSIFNKIANLIFPLCLIAGLILYLFFDSLALEAKITLIVTISLWLLTLVFRIIQIPVELDASRKAYHQLKDNKILSQDELKIAKNVLSLALITYVANLFKNLYLIYLSIKKAFRRD